jgi:hypothetical protein
MKRKLIKTYICGCLHPFFFGNSFFPTENRSVKNVRLGEEKGNVVDVSALRE